MENQTNPKADGFEPRQWIAAWSRAGGGTVYQGGEFHILVPFGKSRKDKMPYDAEAIERLRLELQPEGRRDAVAAVLYPMFRGEGGGRTMNDATDRRAVLGAMGLVTLATVAGVAATAAAPPSTTDWDRLVLAVKKARHDREAYERDEDKATEAYFAAWDAMMAYPAPTIAIALAKADMVVATYGEDVDASDFAAIHADLRRLAK